MSRISHPVELGKRYRITTEAGKSVTERREAVSKVVANLPRDTVIVVAEVGNDNGIARLRIGSPSGWIAADGIEPVAGPKSRKLDRTAFEERHLLMVPGDNYGLPLPLTLDDLHAAGAEFLTAAFRAAGTIAPDNMVTEISRVKAVPSAGASDHGFLTIAYAKPEPGLMTELFVKLPTSDWVRKAEMSGMAYGEIEFHRLTQRQDIPVRVARTYFADYSTYTSNSILITDCIDFGVAPIEPAHAKGYDQHVPAVEEHYLGLTRALAKLVAAHKNGELGTDIEQIFPFGGAARDFGAIPNSEALIDRMIDFVGRVAPQLFLPEATSSEFLARWREDLIFGMAHKDEVIAHLNRDVDYSGFCHPNLNLDNAWFWRDDSQDLQVGLLDWGGVGQMSIAQAMSGMLMMPPPELYLQLVHGVISTFIAEHETLTGIRLDKNKLVLLYKASVFSTAIGTILQFCVDYLSSIPEDDYRNMKDRSDAGLQASGLAPIVIWIDNMLRDWHDEMTPGEACRIIVGGAAT